MAADFGGYADEAFPDAPALSTWVSRARATGYTAALTEAAVVDLLGIASGAITPVAPLSYLQDFGEPPPAACLRADPVHLRVDNNGLILFDSASFVLNEDDSRLLVETLDRHLAVDAYRLVHGHAQRWYLLLEQAPALITASLPKRRGTPVSPVPFTGKDTAVWTTRLNEIQMLLHNHPINQARVARKQVAINSVWLWGAGDLPMPGNQPFTRLWADNACACGAARWCGISGSDLPRKVEPLLPRLRRDERVLVIMETCRDAAAYGDFSDWQAAVQDLEKNWFAPLVEALRRGRIDGLELLPLNGKRYQLERKHLKFFWKRVWNYHRRDGFRQADATRV